MPSTAGCAPATGVGAPPGCTSQKTTCSATAHASERWCGPTATAQSRADSRRRIGTGSSSRRLTSSRSPSSATAGSGNGPDQSCGDETSGPLTSSNAAGSSSARSISPLWKRRLRHGGGPAVMDVALQRHTELSQLWRAHLRHRGRHGSPRARMLLQAAGDNTHSKAERLLVEILKRASSSDGSPTTESAPSSSMWRSRRSGSSSRLTGGRFTATLGVPARPGQAELPGPARLAGAAVHLAGPRRRSRPRRCRDPGGLWCLSRAERGSNTTNHSRATTRWRMPVCRLLRVHSTGATTRTDSNRVSISSNSTRSSSRARLAPRQ